MSIYISQDSTNAIDSTGDRFNQCLLGIRAFMEYRCIAAGKSGKRDFDIIGRRKRMLSGMELIKAYRANPDYYLPMIDHTEEMPERNEYGENNIGWNAGLLEETRPYFVECWAVDQISMLTIYVSAKEIEKKTAKELEQWLQDVGYFRYRDDKYSPAKVETIKDPDGNEFFVISIAVGIEDEPALINGAPIISWKVLNEYNRKTTG